jgi:hypothetical protein
MVKIWLDDVREAPRGWQHYKTAEDLIEYIELIGWHNVSVISLDHDLGENIKTGYDFLKWAEKWFSMYDEKHIPKFEVHSANPVGVKNMKAAIGSIERHFR